MVHAALLLLMLEGRHNDGPRFTISLKRSTQNLQLSTSWAGRLSHLTGEDRLELWFTAWRSVEFRVRSFRATVLILPGRMGKTPKLAPAKNAFPGIKCCRAEFLLNPYQLVVFGQAVGARQRACFDLAAVGGDRQVGNSSVFRFTRTM